MPAAMREPPDLMDDLPHRLPPRAWVATLLGFALAYGFMFSVVHVLADTRPCIARIDDPFFKVIPRDLRWYLVTHTVYYFFTFGGIGALAWRAFRGDHRPLMRFAAALTVQAVLRSATIWLLPLCRFTVEPGTVVLREVPTVDLGFARIPWRTWASNDLVFSGHVGEFLLLSWVTRHWPAPARWALVVFQILQAYGLLATRGHYTVDLLLAVPCAFFADAVARRALARLSRPSRA